MKRLSIIERLADVGGLSISPKCDFADWVMKQRPMAEAAGKGRIGALYVLLKMS